MKQILLMIAVVALVGCGNDKQSVYPEGNNSTPAKSAKEKTEKEPSSKSDDKNSNTEKPAENLTLKEMGKKYVFVVDMSGKMANDGEKTRFRGVKDHMIKFISGMRDEDKFSVIFYNTRLEKLPPSDTLTQATAANKTKAIAWINSKKPGGEFDLLPALQSGLKMNPDTLWLLTASAIPQKSGEAIFHSLDQLKEKVLINCFAIDFHPGSIMQKIAKATGGSTRMVSSSDPNF